MRHASMGKTLGKAFQMDGYSPRVARKNLFSMSGTEGYDYPLRRPTSIGPRMIGAKSSGPMSVMFGSQAIQVGSK